MALLTGPCRLVVGEVHFTDVTQEVGIYFQHVSGKSISKRVFETMGAGAAFLDYDNDGFYDLYLVNGGQSPISNQFKSQSPVTNSLYRNNGDGTFSDVTQSAGVGDNGYGMGVGTGDINNDGFTDLYITNFGPNVLYQNNGDGTFSDVTRSAGVGDDSWGTSCGFFDFDLDGDLDLYVVNYLHHVGSNKPCINFKTGLIEYCHPQTLPPAADIFYRNNGDSTFSLASIDLGLGEIPPRRGLGIGFGDFNSDGLMDIYVANDTDPNFLFFNRGETFEEAGMATGTALSKDGWPEGGMGVDVGDYNNDGWLDIFVTNTESNTLYQNMADGTFLDVSESTNLGGVTATLVGFGTKFIDFDNDGNLDLFIANGHVQDSISIDGNISVALQRDQLYRNNGEGAYYELSSPSKRKLVLQTDSYFSRKNVGRGTSSADYDNDGDLDLLITNCNRPPVLLRNDSQNDNHWLVFEIIDKHGKSSIGTTLRYMLNGQKQIRQLQSSASYLSAHDPRIFIGLGKISILNEVDIQWPSGQSRQLKNIKSNQLIKLVEHN